MADREGVTYGEPGPPLSRGAPYLRGFLWTLGALTAIAVGFGIREAADELELVLIAAFLAVGLHPAVQLAERRGVKRGWAVLVIAVLLLGLITVVVFVFASALRGQIASFINDAPHLIEDLRHNRTIAHLDARYHVLSTLENKLRHSDLGDTVADKIFDASSSILSTVIGTVVVFVLTLYFLAALPKITRGMYSLAPASR
ncbi:MAG: AI-2E family transporter, partial [Actinobacteria bacterium]|nr:AI-2E family transporter [Actinomycetota bacterium]